MPWLIYLGTGDTASASELTPRGVSAHCACVRSGVDVISGLGLRSWLSTCKWRWSDGLLECCAVGALNITLLNRIPIP